MFERNETSITRKQSDRIDKFALMRTRLSRTQLMSVKILQIILKLMDVSITSKNVT